MKKLCVITNKYPNKLEKNILVFLQQLVWEMADQNNNCTVICPVPININPKYLKLPFKTTEKTENGSEVTIYFPKYIGFGQSKILGYNPAKITTNTFTNAVRRTIKALPSLPDILYSHFVTPAGIAAARLGKEFNIPSYMAYGEATGKSLNNYGIKEATIELKSLTGVISVSSHNKERLVNLGVIKEEKIGVFPNGVREKRFYPRDKNKAREMFGLPKDKFIVSFVGSFDHRKGIERLIEAVEGLDDVYVICAGRGKLTPNSDRCLYQGPVNYKDLPYFYSAYDIFVLPTLNEGCANVIIEAMACGLPIVSSDLPFNDDILDAENSIRVNPTEVNQIRKAIQTLKTNNDIYLNTKRHSLEKSKHLTLEKRTSKIIKFLS